MRASTQPSISPSLLRLMTLTLPVADRPSQWRESYHVSMSWSTEKILDTTIVRFVLYALRGKKHRNLQRQHSGGRRDNRTGASVIPPDEGATKCHFQMY